MGSCLSGAAKNHAIELNGSSQRKLVFLEEPVSLPRVSVETKAREVPPEIIDIILAYARWDIPPSEHLPLLLVSRLAYECVSYATYHTLAINSHSTLLGINALVHSRPAPFFANRTRGLWVSLSLEGSDPVLADPSIIWNSIISVLSNLEFLRTWCTRWLTNGGPTEVGARYEHPESSERAKKAAFDCFFSLSHLRMLTLDWQLTPFLSITPLGEYPAMQSITHLTLSSFLPDPLKTLSSFTSLTHIHVFFGFSTRNEQLQVDVMKTLHAAPDLHILLISPAARIYDGPQRFWFDRDPRVVFDWLDDWTSDRMVEFVETAGGCSIGLGIDYWKRAEQEVEMRRLIGEDSLR